MSAYSMRWYPHPLTKRRAGTSEPSQAPSIPNHMPSSSFTGGDQTPPISPRVWKPIAG